MLLCSSLSPNGHRFLNPFGYCAQNVNIGIGGSKILRTFSKTAGEG